MLYEWNLNQKIILTSIVAFGPNINPIIYWAFSPHFTNEETEAPRSYQAVQNYK